jgi:sulfatase modifying factor 1
VTPGGVALLAALAAAPPHWIEPVTGMAFVTVPAGRFVMGSPPDEPGREAQETRHEVRLTRAFQMGRLEVTQAQWTRVMGVNPSAFAGGDRPVERVSWNDVQEFLRRLGRLSPGSTFRLPSEAEWEYACRAGAATAYAGGEALTHAEANFREAGVEDAAYAGQTVPVGSFPPNAWGLFDMSGNVWEWTGDDYCPYPDGPATDPRPSCAAALKVIRGGSWYFGADSARCALRYTHAPGASGFSLGFRVVREAP